MQNTNDRAVMVCPINARICKNGRRDDFPKDETGQLVQCRMWVHLYGKDPQTERQIDQWDCAVAWLPTTTVETSQRASQAAASFDKVANEVQAVGNKFVQAAKIMISGQNERGMLQSKKQKTTSRDE